MDEETEESGEGATKRKAEVLRAHGTGRRVERAQV